MYEVARFSCQRKRVLTLAPIASQDTGEISSGALGVLSGRQQLKSDSVQRFSHHAHIVERVHQRADGDTTSTRQLATSFGGFRKKYKASSTEIALLGAVSPASMVNTLM